MTKPNVPDGPRGYIAISKAHQMMRVQVAMWVDGKTACSACKKPYESVDDFLARNPKAGPGWPDDSWKLSAGPKVTTCKAQRTAARSCSARRSKSIDDASPTTGQREGPA